MENRVLIRVWNELELKEVQERLLIAGDPLGDCAKCREVGINVQNSRVCPKCGTEFRYIATRLGSSPVQASRLKRKRPDLIAIDLSDFKSATGRQEALRFMNPPDFPPIGREPGNLDAGGSTE